MAISSILSTAVNGLLSSAERAGRAAEKIVTADVSKETVTGGALDVEDLVTLSDPAIARAEGLMELSQAETSFKANAAVIRAEDELTERLLDIEA